MGQLESLRELSIAQSKKKKYKKIKLLLLCLVIQFDGDPSEFWDIESLHIGINLKPHDYVLVHLTLNWTCDALTRRL
jgi:hypothetical protein